MGVKTLNELEGYRGGGEVANRQMFGHHGVQRDGAQLNDLSSIAEARLEMQNMNRMDWGRAGREKENMYCRLLFLDLKEDAWLRVCDKARDQVAPMMVRSSAMRSPSPTFIMSVPGTPKVHYQDTSILYLDNRYLAHSELESEHH